MKSKQRIDWDSVREELDRAVRLSSAADSTAEHRALLFHVRAKALAVPAEEARSPNPEELVAIFQFGSGRFAVPVSSLAEVIPSTDCNLVPGATPDVIGVIQVRGAIRPVYDLAKMLGIESGATAWKAILLVRSEGFEFGIRVGEIEEIRAVPSSVRLPSSLGPGYEEWMTEDFVPVLAVKTLLGDRAWKI